MSYPFPGMNPWLENPLLWRDVHHRLISAMADDLGMQLAPRYFVAVETHTYITRSETRSAQVRYPDVMLVERGGAPVMSAPALAPIPESVLVELPDVDPIIEGFLEVRLVPSGEVVTVIELLSHTNKRVGEHRDEYLEKRASILHSRVHFVELDLLRAGKSMPQAEPVECDYRLFVRRRENFYQARVYPFGVRQAIPIFPLPLLPGDQEPLLDIGTLLKSVYDRARYDLVIDYAQETDPPLPESDVLWASEQLAVT